MRTTMNEYVENLSCALTKEENGEIDEIKCSYCLLDGWFPCFSRMKKAIRSGAFLRVHLHG